MDYIIISNEREGENVKTVDLFSGCGGLSLGFEQEGKLFASSISNGFI